MNQHRRNIVADKLPALQGEKCVILAKGDMYFELLHKDGDLVDIMGASWRTRGWVNSAAAGGWVRRPPGHQAAEDRRLMGVYVARRAWAGPVREQPILGQCSARPYGDTYAVSQPACWNGLANWVEWNRLNEQAGSAPDKPLDHFCTDCTPDFQARNVARGRCAYPDAVFQSITERRRDPTTGKVKMVDTGQFRGRRSQADEEAWTKRYQIRKEEK